MPSSLQGLNIVYPPPRPSDNPSQDLTPPPGFPDLSAQLDLWTNLSFASDEPFIDKHRKELAALEILDQKFADGDEAEASHERSLFINADKPARTPIDIGILSIPPAGHEGSTDVNGNQGSFDLGSFLAGFGIDPFLVPPQASLPPTSDLSSIPRLQKPTISPLSSTSDVSAPAFPNRRGETPVVKRSRTRQDSSASQASAIAPSALQQRSIGSERAVSEFSEDHDPLTTPLTTSEDKRRRNTAASARFRAKKKEREQALEKRSRDLENKVNELERECEGLRRENGWLKGLVVGVTGGNPSSVPTIQTDSNTSANDSSRGKRKRDMETNEGPLEGR